MRRFMLPAVAVVVAVAVIGCQKAEKPPEKPKVTIPAGQVLVRDADLRDLSGQTRVHLLMARDALQKRDTKMAAGELRTATAFMRLELARGKAQGKKGLKASIDELTKLADGLGGGTKMVVSDLNVPAARADYALALHHYYVAAAAIKAGADKKAAHDLTASVQEAQDVFRWVKRKQTTEEKGAASQVEELAAKMAGGTAVGAQDVDRAMSALKTYLDGLSATVEPAKGGTPAQG